MGCRRFFGLEGIDYDNDCATPESGEQSMIHDNMIFKNKQLFCHCAE
jgi:hypothetical protein